MKEDRLAISGNSYQRHPIEGRCRTPRQQDNVLNKNVLNIHDSLLREVESRWAALNRSQKREVRSLVRRLEARRMIESFEAFVRGAWPIVEPGKPLLWDGTSRRFASTSRPSPKCGRRSCS